MFIKAGKDELQVYKNQRVKPMIREMKYNDIERVNSLLQDAFEVDYSARGIDAIKRTHYMKIGYLLEKTFAFFVKSYHRTLNYYVWEENNQVVGCLRIGRHSETASSFDIVAVDRDCRKKGIAYALQTYGENMCRERGGKYVYLTVNEENLPSLNLVGKSGFTKYSRCGIYFLENPPPYRDRRVEGFSMVRRGDYEEIAEREKEVLSKKVVEIEGVIQKPSHLSRLIILLRRLLFREDFSEYVLRHEGRVAAYSKVGHFSDGSSTLELVFFEDCEMLRDFIEKILFHKSKRKMSASPFEEQIRENQILKELGFRKYFAFFALYKEL